MRWGKTRLLENYVFLDQSKCIAFFVKNSYRDFYNSLPLKFGEGNVFTDISLSMGRRVSRSLDRSNGRVHPQTWDLFKLVHLRTYPHPHIVLTPSGSHQKIYSWQAGSRHPTGMWSCYCLQTKFGAR